MPEELSGIGDGEAWTYLVFVFLGGVGALGIRRGEDRSSIAFFFFLFFFFEADSGDFQIW